MLVADRLLCPPALSLRFRTYVADDEMVVCGWQRALARRLQGACRANAAQHLVARRLEDRVRGDAGRGRRPLRDGGERLRRRAADPRRRVRGKSGVVSRRDEHYVAGFGPSWSPDGTQLAFAQTLEDCGGGWDYSRPAASGGTDSARPRRANGCYTYDAISVAYSGGSNLRVFTTGNQPAWRPHP